MGSKKELELQFQRHLESRGIKNGANFGNFIDKSTSESQEKSKQLLSSFLLHAADLSSTLKPFEEAKEWTTLLYEEFFNQGDTEKQLGLPVSFLCDRSTTNIPNAQFGFISNMVMPTYSLLSILSPDVAFVQMT